MKFHKQLNRIGGPSTPAINTVLFVIAVILLFVPTVMVLYNIGKYVSKWMNPERFAELSILPFRTSSGSGIQCSNYVDAGNIIDCSMIGVITIIIGFLCVMIVIGLIDGLRQIYHEIEVLRNNERKLVVEKLD